MTLGWFDDSMHAQTLVLRRVSVGKPDADGVAATADVEHKLEGYSVQPVGSDETIAAEKVITSKWRASGPVTDLVREFDIVDWAGDSYQVQGSPRTFTGGVLDHTEFYMTTVKG